MKRSTKHSLLLSILALVLCTAMLLGTTFAWFTDNASTAVNKIQAGTLKIQLLDARDNELSASNPLTWQKAAGAPADEQVLWEPGCTYNLQTFKIQNNGNLALKYKVVLKAETVDKKNDKTLLDVIDWVIKVNNEVLTTVTSEAIKDGLGTDDGIVIINDRELPVGDSGVHTIEVQGNMKEEAGNEYQGLKIDDFGVTVYAAQASVESDSEDNAYDIMAGYDTHSPAVPPVVDVGNAAQLQAALEKLNTTGMIDITQDIDLTGFNWESPTMSYTSPSETITINGNGHTISNLTSTGNQYGGLIGKLSTNGNVVIKNINLENVNLTGTNIDGECAGGALIGWMDCHDGTVAVENVTVNGVNIDGFKYTGGLIGYKNGDTALNLTDCSVTGTDAAKTINSSYNESGNYKGHIGGLVGYYGKGTMDNCTLSNIDITRSGNAQSDRAGVLVGTLESGASITSATVSNVTLLGAPVTSTSNMVGPGASHGSVSGVTVD